MLPRQDTSHHTHKTLLYNLNMPLFHKDIFVPADLELPTGEITLKYSHHVRERCTRHKGKLIELPSVIDFADFDIIEIEAENNTVTKVLIRGDYDDYFDIILVIMPQTGLVKTTWLNYWDDNHKTLDTSKYERF